MRHLGPRPHPVSPLGGAKLFFSNSIFSVTARDIAAVLSPLCAPLGPLYSAPTHWGPGPPFGGRVPPTENFHFWTVMWLYNLYCRDALHIVRGWRSLTKVLFLKNSVAKFWRKWGSKFFVGVALWQNPPLVAPSCGHCMLHFLCHGGLWKMPLGGSGFLLPVSSYELLKNFESSYFGPLAEKIWASKCHESLTIGRGQGPL